jgi:hypothetical protein
MLKRLLGWQPKNETAATFYKAMLFIGLVLAGAYLGKLLKLPKDCTNCPYLWDQIMGIFM